MTDPNAVPPSPSKVEARENEMERKTVRTFITRTYSSERFENPSNDKIYKLQNMWNGEGQGHVFKFLKTLTETKRKILINQLEEIDVKGLKLMREQAIQTEKDMKDPANMSSIPTTPMSSSSNEEKQRWRELGFRAISEGQVAALVLAGGQGSRLGSTDPKGMYNIGLPSTKSLFQYQGERIVKLQQLVSKHTGKNNVVIPWYVMTSPTTHSQTMNFFQSHNYFGLKPENVLFFEQGNLPSITPEGRVIMESKCRIFVAPDGNGGLYRALKEKGILADMNKRGVKWVTQYCVDNILSKVADPIFIGFCAEREALLGCKVVKKVDPDEKVGLVVLKNGKATVAEYSEISPELIKKRDSTGGLELRAAHMCINCYHIQFLEDAASKLKTKYHIARKKIPTIDENGKKYTPSKENGWKLEQFIFDPFDQIDPKKVVVMEVPREEEFSALKNPPGSKSDCPDTARVDLSNLHKLWIKNAGGSFVETDSKNNLCEISHLISYDGEGLEELVKGKQFTLPLYLK